MEDRNDNTIIQKEVIHENVSTGEEICNMEETVDLENIFNEIKRDGIGTTDMTINV